MISVAIKMLIGNRAYCIGVIFGVFLATLLISQQSAIFLGLVARSYRMVSDNPLPNLWVVDPVTESDEKVRSMPAGYLDIVRGIPEIEWAVPLNVTSIPLVTETGIYQISQLYGLDDATFIGAPMEIVSGNIKDLRREGSVIVDIYSANGIMQSTLSDGTKVPLQLGDSIEINNHRAVVVGLCRITQGFYPQPIIFTSNQSFRYFTGGYSDKISFITAKTKPGADIQKVKEAINAYPQLNALTADDLKWRIAVFFLKTGILINFGLSVALGIIIGFSIAGQIFYIMTLQNLMYFALIKSLGGDKKMITKMIIVQTGIVGVIGYLLGTGATILWGIPIKNTTLAFLFPWQLLVFTSFIATIICVFTAWLSIRKVLKTDPKVLMGN